MICFVYVITEPLLFAVKYVAMNAVKILISEFFSHKRGFNCILL